MIVTLQMATTAAKELELPFRGEGFAAITAEEVQSAYRRLAKYHHPDKGGCMDDFVQLDRSKEILLRWLVRPKAAAVDMSISSDKCVPCKGTGRRTLQRGFRSMTMVCGSCRGTGERIEIDKVEE